MTDEGMEVEVKVTHDPPLWLRILVVAVFVTSIGAGVFSMFVNVATYRQSRANNCRMDALLDRVQAELSRQIADDDEREAEDGFACWGAE